MLHTQDKLAIEIIFRDSNELSSEIKSRLKHAESTNREETGVGFYSTIKLNSPLKKVPDIKMWEFNFSHPSFPDGGSYMCTIVSENEFELEAVTLGGADWPNPNDPTLFKELS